MFDYFFDLQSISSMKADEFILKKNILSSFAW